MNGRLDGLVGREVGQAGFNEGQGTVWGDEELVDGIEEARRGEGERRSELIRSRDRLALLTNPPLNLSPSDEGDYPTPSTYETSSTLCSATYNEWVSRLPDLQIPNDFVLHFNREGLSEDEEVLERPQ